MIKITAYKCKKCGRIHYPKHERCLDCKQREF
ncbi:MAG: zinc ribbon domain-containing protein, partial [Anaerolineae bacterium]